MTGLPVARLPANLVNVVRIHGIDCDIAIQLDRATDDGNVDTGNFRTAAGQDENILVLDAVLRVKQAASFETAELDGVVAEKEKTRRSGVFEQWQPERDHLQRHIY